MGTALRGVGFRWWLVFGTVIAVYLFINLGMGWIPTSGMVKSYVIQPLLWGFPLWAALSSPKYRPAGKIGDKPSIIQLALMIGFLHLVLYIIGGLFSGFGKSPSSFTALGILRNLFLVGATLIGMETSRAWLINHLGKAHSFFAIAFTAVIYTAVSIPLAQFRILSPDVQAMNFLNSTLIPSLAENLLASSLALSAGPLASIAYRGMLQAFWWFCPILPDLSFAFKGLLGTGVPLAGVALLQNLFPIRTKHARIRRTSEGSPTSWIVTTIFSVAIIWFAVGLFPIQPSVVLSGSMEPMMYAGDVAIVVKTPADTVEVGDVIQFRMPEEITIMHRVIEIRETEAAKVFITKGDANDSPDDPVIPQNIVGKVVLTVPKVGWLAILIKGFFTG